jgi:hypothetical protein
LQAYSPWRVGFLDLELLLYILSGSIHLKYSFFCLGNLFDSEIKKLKLCWLPQLKLIQQPGLLAWYTLTMVALM